MLAQKLGPLDPVIDDVKERDYEELCRNNEVQENIIEGYAGAVPPHPEQPEAGAGTMQRSGGGGHYVLHDKNGVSLK